MDLNPWAAAKIRELMALVLAALVQQIAETARIEDKS